MEQSTNAGAGHGSPPTPSLESVLDRMESAADDLGALMNGTLAGWDAPSAARLTEAHSRVRRLTGRLDGARYAMLTRIEEDGSWRTGGMSRTFPSWLRLREGVAATTARKDVTTARRLAAALPATQRLLLTGELGADHARVMTEVAPTSPTRQDALAWLVDTRTGEPTTPEQFVQTVAIDFPDPTDDPDGRRTRDQITEALQNAITDGTLMTGERLVLREAGTLNADQFRTVARRFATVTDPDTDDTDDDKAAAGEYLDLSRTLGGYHLQGFLADEHGLLLTTALHGVMGAPSVGDDRTPAQRRAQALADVARMVLDINAVSPGASIPPHLNVTVSWTELVTQVTRTREGLCVSCGRRCRSGHRARRRQAARSARRPGCSRRAARCSPRPAGARHGHSCGVSPATARSPASSSVLTGRCSTSDAPTARSPARCGAQSSRGTGTASSRAATSRRRAARSITP